MGPGLVPQDRKRRSDVRWTYVGTADFFSGADATVSERVLLWVGTALLTILIALGVLHQGISWDGWQWAIALVLGFDVVGGAISNSLNAMKRAWYSPIDPDRDTGPFRLFKSHPILFPAVHLHPFLVACVFDASLAYALILYAAPVAFAVFVLFGPLYLHRPVSFLTIIVILLVSLYALDQPAGMEWFAVVFAIKLIQAHAVQEEPYARPD